MRQSAKYLEGYKTGRNWTESYRPGGPFTCKSTSPSYADMVKKTKADNEEWQAGFTAGLKKRDEANAKV